MIRKFFVRVRLKISKILIKKRLHSILRKKKSEAIFLIGSPLHGNIGDHAISIAENLLLKNIKNKQIIEIPGRYYDLFDKEIKKDVAKEDVIIITGGGFIGSLWINEENMVRSIIKNFPENKIIIMPQTIFFEETEDGQEELKISKKIYENHKDLHIFTREEKSFQYCKEKLEDMKNIYLVPDIVTYLDYQLPKEKREGILLCLRSDKERVISKDSSDILVNKLKCLKLPIKETTTVINKNISIRKRNKIFENKINEFKKSKIVITDRLHGMIFAAITATPCIAMDNLSGKVKGVYKWFEKLDYIKFIENDSNIEDSVRELLKNEDAIYNVENYRKEFKIIIDLLSK